MCSRNFSSLSRRSIFSSLSRGMPNPLNSPFFFYDKSKILGAIFVSRASLYSILKVASRKLFISASLRVVIFGKTLVVDELLRNVVLMGA